MHADEYARMQSRILEGIRHPEESDFFVLAQELYTFQRRWNPHYDRYCTALNAPEIIQAWDQIPAVPQNAFKRFELRSFPAEETAKVFRTSGTTGEGFGQHFFRSTELYDESILRGWARLELPRLPQIIFVQSPGDAPCSSLSHMMGVLSQVTSSQKFCIDAAGTLIDAHLEKITAKPVLLMGTALAFFHLMESCERLPLPEGSWLMETGGYKGSGRTLAKSEFYGQLERFFNIPAAQILNEYSMTELSSQFYTHGIGKPHEGPPWARALVIDPESNLEAEEGATGLVRIIDLANIGSVLAVQTQDLAVRRGNRFELVGRDPSALPRGCSRAADEMLSR